MITVRGKRLAWRPEMTVRDLLKEIGYDLPSVLVRVDGEIVRRKEWDSRMVPDEAVIDAHHVVAGG
jgi:sulfur carrier protein